MGALVLGTVLAVAALGFVLYPVFFGVAPRRVARVVRDASSDGDSAVLALREIEFDRATGKLSDADYGDLKSRYTALAIAAMRRRPRESASAVEDEIEAAVNAYRAAHPACAACGPRLEDDAIYCSNCGRYLHDKCAGCGAPVEALDARYCVNCGDRLAA